MKISVVISAYRAEQFIEECLDSIFIQDNLHEVLVAVDGCETTRTELLRIKHKYDDRLQLFYSHENRSPYPNINAMIHRSTGTHIVPIGADDVFRPRAFRKLSHKAYDCDVVRFKAHNFGTVSDSRIGKDYYPGGAKLFRRRVFDLLGGFPRPYSSSDSDLQFRIDRFHKHIRSKLIADVLCDRRIHENNLTRTIPRSERSISYRQKTYNTIEEAYFEPEKIEYVLL